MPKMAMTMMISMTAKVLAGLLVCAVSEEKNQGQTKLPQID
jgi:hypothetical protein